MKILIIDWPGVHPRTAARALGHGLHEKGHSPIVHPVQLDKLGWFKAQALEKRAVEVLKVHEPDLVHVFSAEPWVADAWTGHGVAVVHSAFDRGSRADNGPRGNNGGGQQQQPKQQRDRPDRGDRGDRNGRGRDRGGRQDQSPAPIREAGDPAYIPNPLQQTFDRRAIQQRERPVVVDYDDDSDGPIGPIPNPKDPVENALNHAVCSGRVSLRAAQRAIAADWLTAESVLGVGAAPAPYRTTAPLPAASHPASAAAGRYRAGEYCSVHGSHTTDSHGRLLTCAYENGWRWEH